MRDCPFCRAPPSRTDSQILARVRKRVDKGDPVAIFNLGFQYERGQHGLETDVTRAVELYERAAELGVKNAHYNLGMDDCPFCRVPRPNTGGQALVMVRKRMDAGDAVAIWHLGSQHRFGRCGLGKDVTRAVEIYERAAELGVKDAHYNLGVLYAKGIEVEKDDMAKATRPKR